MKLSVWLIAGTALWYCFLSVHLLAAAPPLAADEYRVKAAFLMNFTKFVQWPPDSFTNAKSPIFICVLGEDPFGRTLDQMVEGEVVDEHKLAIRRIREAPEPGLCQVLFFEGNKESTKKEYLAHIIAGAGRGMLTVGEGDDFLQNGGMVAFVIENRRVRFDINQNAAAKAKLKLNAKLLSVARSVSKND